jgi:hypothetical protein
MEQLNLTIAYVDPEIAGKRVGQNHCQRFSWHWPGDDELILPIGTSIVDVTILSIKNAAFAGLLDPSRKIGDLRNYLVQPDGVGGPYSHNVTPIFNNITPAGWVKAAMKLSNLMRV